VLVDAGGRVSVAVERGSAAERLGVGAGSVVAIHRSS
jgi:S-adenosylmethionine hydrolase